MPSLKKVEQSNPLTGAGIIRYFDVEEGISVDPKIIVSIVIAFILLEIIFGLIL